jgi:hypothetical protein
MSTVTVVPTVEAGNVPPRVRLDVTDTGSPSVFATTVTRLTPDGAPLTLITSGANRVGLVYDYEVPFAAGVRYSTLESPTVISSEVTVPVGRPWLIHPGVPALSMPVEFRIGSFDEEEWAVEQGVYWPMGREHPVVQTDGQRKAPASSVTLHIESLQELRDVKALLADAGTLLLNVPPTLGIGVDTCYIAVGNVRNRRPSSIGSDPYRALELPFRVVDAPVGGSQAERTYADLLAFPSYANLQAAFPDYSAVLAGP